MSYHNDLAYQLRRRGCTESAVADVLYTVDEAVSSSGRPAEEECGSPAQYAEQFDGPQKTTPGRRVLNVCGALGLLCVAVYAIWPQWFGITTPVLEQFAGIIALAVFLVAGVLIGTVIDHRLPAAYAGQVRALHREP